GVEWRPHVVSLRESRCEMAPAVGLEPTTKRLTAARSTTELRRSGADRRTLGRGREGRRSAGAKDSTGRRVVGPMLAGRAGLARRALVVRCAVSVPERA